MPIDPTTEAMFACADPAVRDALWRHLVPPPQAPQLAFSPRIHPADQMLRHSIRHWGDPWRALSQYYGVALQQHRLAVAVLDAAAVPPAGRFLDFACGFGRLQRFLSLTHPQLDITASDIQADAVDFCVGEYGARGLYSTARPADFRSEHRFHCIWVASLFSHLPRAAFHEWLSRLHDLLGPEGILCFSVHDVSGHPQPVDVPADGFSYTAGSELEELGAESYGTTFVTEAFVRDAVARCVGSDVALARIPRALANHQDLYVLGAPGLPVQRLQDLPRGQWGCVDVIIRSSPDRLKLAGWAALLDSAPARHVEIRVGEHVTRCAPRIDRFDVRDATGDARLLRSGWEIEVPVGAAPLFVEVSAHSDGHAPALLHFARLD